MGPVPGEPVAATNITPAVVPEAGSVEPDPELQNITRACKSTPVNAGQGTNLNDS